MKELIRELRESLKAYFILKVAGWKLSTAIMIANAKQHAYNRRYVVLPVGSRLMVFCNRDIDRMKRTRANDPRKVNHLYHAGKINIHRRRALLEQTVMSRKATWLDVEKECYYMTPFSLNNTTTMSAEDRKRRREQWEKDYKAMRQ